MIHRDPPLWRPDVRGFGFLLCGFIWLVMALGIYQGYSGTDPAAPHTQIPFILREMVWVVPGVMAFVAAYHPRWHGVTLSLLIVAPLIRVFSYAWAWLMFMIPGTPPGRESGWYSSVLHLAFIGIVVLVASVPAGRRHQWAPPNGQSSEA